MRPPWQLSIPTLCGANALAQWLGCVAYASSNDNGLPISLQLDMSGDTLNGQPITAQGVTKTFSSWLGMIGALDLLVADGSVQATRP